MTHLNLDLSADGTECHCDARDKARLITGSDPARTMARILLADGWSPQTGAKIYRGHVLLGWVNLLDLADLAEESAA